MRTIRFVSALALTGALSIAAASSALAQGRAPALSVDGALHARDVADARGRHQSVMAVRVDGGQGLDVSVQSEAFDPMVRVLGPDGALVAANDDAPGEGLNSRVRFRVAQPGTYRVVVTSYSPGEVGAYHLEVRRGVSVAAPTAAAADEDEDEDEDGTERAGANADADDDDDDDDARPAVRHHDRRANGREDRDDEDTGAAGADDDDDDDDSEDGAQEHSLRAAARVNADGAAVRVGRGGRGCAARQR